MEIICGNCGPIHEHKKSCPLSKDTRIKELEDREIRKLDEQAKENMRIDAELKRLRAIVARAEDVKGIADMLHRLLSVNSSLRPIEIARAVAKWVKEG